MSMLQTFQLQSIIIIYQIFLLWTNFVSEQKQQQQLQNLGLQMWSVRVNLRVNPIWQSRSSSSSNTIPGSLEFSTTSVCTHFQLTRPSTYATVQTRYIRLCCADSLRGITVRRSKLQLMLGHPPPSFAAISIINNNKLMMVHAHSSIHTTAKLMPIQRHISE